MDMRRSFVLQENGELFSVLKKYQLLGLGQLWKFCQWNIHVAQEKRWNQGVWIAKQARNVL